MEHCSFNTRLEINKLMSKLLKETPTTEEGLDILEPIFKEFLNLTKVDYTFTTEDSENFKKLHIKLLETVG